VLPLDAIIIVNELLEFGIGELPPPTGEIGAAAATPHFIDTNGDNVRSPSDVIKVINRLLAPPTVSLVTLMPFTVDLTPRLIVSAAGDEAIPDGATVHLDVDLDNNGLFAGDELDYTTTSMYEGRAEFALDPALPAPTPGSTYNIKLRAWLQDAEGLPGTSASQPMIVDTRMSAVETYVMR
jgi:hypothetical protein